MAICRFVFPGAISLRCVFHLDLFNALHEVFMPSLHIGIFWAARGSCAKPFASMLLCQRSWGLQLARLRQWRIMGNCILCIPIASVSDCSKYNWMSMFCIVLCGYMCMCASQDKTCVKGKVRVILGYPGSALAIWSPNIPQYALYNPPIYSRCMVVQNFRVHCQRHQHSPFECPLLDTV